MSHRYIIWSLRSKLKQKLIRKFIVPPVQADYNIYFCLNFEDCKDDQKCHTDITDITDSLLGHSASYLFFRCLNMSKNAKRVESKKVYFYALPSVKFFEA